MGSLLLLLAGAGVAATGVLSRPRHALALLVALTVLVPATLAVPNGVSPLPTFLRVAVVSVALGLLRRPDSARLFAVTQVHVAAGLFALGTLVTGVLLAPSLLSFGGAVQQWLNLLEALTLFVVTLACVRAVDDRPYTLRVLAAVGIAAAVLGVVEHLTGRSLGGTLFALSPSQDPGPLTTALERRAGQTRVRVGQEFALQYAWVTAALLPAVLAAPWARFRLPLRLVGAVLLVLAGYWSFSRTAPVALFLGLLVLVLGLRSRRAAALLGTGALAALTVVLALPSVTARFGAGVDQGALDVRAERRPVVLEAVAQRPLGGIGLGGIRDLGLTAVDQTYLLAYTETGVVGALLLVAALGTGVLVCARGLRAGPSSTRTTCAVSLAGAVVLLGAGFAFDALSLRSSTDLLWLLLAVGVASGERTQGVLRPTLPTDARRRAAGVVAAVVVGSAVAVLWPSHVAVSTVFRTLPVAREAGGFDPVGIGRTLVATTCGVAQAVAATDPEVSLDCRAREPAAGFGTLRIEAPTEAQARSVLRSVVLTTRERTRVTSLQVDLVGPPQRGVPTLARTAPVWFGLSALLLALLVTGQHREPGAGGRPGRVVVRHVGPGLQRPRGPRDGVAQQVGEGSREAVGAGQRLAP